MEKSGEKWRVGSGKDIGGHFSDVFTPEPCDAGTETDPRGGAGQEGLEPVTEGMGEVDERSGGGGGGAHAESIRR